MTIKLRNRYGCNEKCYREAWEDPEDEDIFIIKEFHAIECGIFHIIDRHATIEE